MSDVCLPSSNQETLPPGPNVPPKSQAAIERLRKRMEGYRDLQTNRLPDYEQTMNHVNSQQMQETLVLRQKYLESKAKKPNKKSSSASSAAASAGDKMKHDMGPAGPGPMNGVMGFHGGPHMGGPGPNMNGPPMGMNGPVSHNGPLGGHQNGPNNMMGAHQNGPNNGATHNKRPLDDDSSNIQSDTAKRLNLDNGNISDQNFIKREPSPHETKFNPGAGPGFGGHGGPPQPQPPQPPQAPAGGQQPQPSPLPDVKPNVNSLKQEMTQDSGQTKSTENSDNIKDELKSEVSDSVKQEDTLNDLDLNLDFTGLGEDINGEVLDDLIGEMGDNFDTFDFDNSKIDEKDNVNLSGASENSGLPSSSAPATNTSSSSTQASGNNGITPAAETLKMMAQQHQGGQPGQQPPYPQAGDQPQPPHNGPMTTPNTSLPSNFQPPHSAMPSQGTPMSSAPNMQQGPPMSSMDSTANSQNMQQQPMQPQRPADGDPRLRAAAQQRFRLGNPNSIANSMAGGGMSVAQNPGMNTHPGMMNSHQRMPMGNNMMNNMPGNQQGGMGPNMQMMNQQQVSYHGIFQRVKILIIKIFADARNGSDDPSANDAYATTANEDAAAPGDDESGGADA